MTKIIYDYDYIKSEVVDFLENDTNWNNVVKLIGWENTTFMAHELYETITDLYMEGVKGAYSTLEEGQEVEYLTIGEYIATWLDGDF